MLYEKCLIHTVCKITYVKCLCHLFTHHFEELRSTKVDSFSHITFMNIPAIGTFFIHNFQMPSDQLWATLHMNLFYASCCDNDTKFWKCEWTYSFKESMHLCRYKLVIEKCDKVILIPICYSFQFPSPWGGDSVNINAHNLISTFKM